MPNKVLAIVNATGRQAASVARVASAVGYMLPSHHLLTHHPVRHPEDSEAKLRSSYQVRAHVSKRVPPAVAHELDALDNVTIIEGSLEDKQLVADLFAGAHKAFVNTVAWGDEVAIGKSLADAAKKAHVQHYVYSSMPDHSIYGKGWPAVPGWSCKFTVENYIRQIGLSATFVYTGIYNNNFTSTPMPLFRMELRPDGSFQWKAPFHPDTLLPWLDAEHDVGPLVIQVFKDGPGKWIGHRIALAFELLSPNRVCRLFSRALRRPVRYIHNPTIDIETSVPDGYRAQLNALEVLFGEYNAPYFGADMENGVLKEPNNSNGGKGDGSGAGSGEGTVVEEARALWGGWRGIEEYAREVFPLEEAANGQTWMNNDEK